MKAGCGIAEKLARMFQIKEGGEAPPSEIQKC